MPTSDGLTAGDVARRLGIAVTTLRTWHQRYGLGPGGHLPHQHRRYTAVDIARLEVMRRLTGDGVPAAEAARVALATGRERPRSGVRAGGGHAIPVGRAGPPVRGLARAAARLDAAAMARTVAAAMQADGVVATWDDLVCPVLVGIGDRHAATQQLVEVEHLLSRTVSEVLAAVPRPTTGPGRVLLACADEEQHSLPIEALAAALAERGVASRLLGARVPPAALWAAVRRTGPAAIFVWSHAPATADPGQLSALLAVRPRPVVIAAAGPGWAEVPAGVVRPTSLVDAVALTLDVVG
jgi:DNA-binding transcriptional MerR regulator